MKLYYDFHIHTGLSPCGDSDMTPNNIVNMAILNELDAIAITDHNTCNNVKAVMDAAKDTSLIVIPGMELETIEEVHVICLFPDFNSCEMFGKYVDSKHMKIKNKSKIFGEQILFDKNDNPIGECDHLLITSTYITIDEVSAIVNKYDGVAVFAHIDRKSNSVISNLGFISEELGINIVEFSMNTDPEVFLIEKANKFTKEYKYLQSSDAHYLGDIAERRRYLTFDTKPDAKGIINKLKAMS